MKHIVRFEAGFDCIKFQCKFKSPRCKPGDGGSHGCHGMQIRFVSQGDVGAIQFLLGTGWLPQLMQPSRIGTRDIHDWGIKTMPYDLGYHSPFPMYNGQTVVDDSCEYCGGKPCYYDGSSLQSYDAMYTLVNGGDDALWAYLDGVYMARFEGGDYPKVAEYPTPLRASPGCGRAGCG